MDSEEARLYYVLWVAIVLLAIIILYFLYVMTRNQSRTLAAMRDQLDSQLQLADADRTMIAGELHDDIQPYLSVLSQKLQLMDIYPDKATLLRGECTQLVDYTLGRTRDLARMILPYSIQQSNLANAVHDFVKRIHQDELNIVWQQDELPSFKPDFLLALCRLLQEIIHNTIKHSKAGSLRIDVRYNVNTLIIRTAESGWHNNATGIKSRPGGVGRELMNSRVRLLGGNLHVDADKHNGVRYVISVPVTLNQIQ